MTISEQISNLLHRKDRVKDILEERRAERLAIQRDKNSNERELERLREEVRQKQIKKELDYRRKERQKDINKSFLLNKQKNIIKQKPLFSSRSTILNGKGGF